MKHFIALCLVLSFSSAVEACQRCGSFSHCKLAVPVYHAPAVVQQAYPVSVTNFNIVSSYPEVPLVGGNTAYFAPLSADVLSNQAARLAESATTLQKMSLEATSKATEASIALERERAILAAILQAAGATGINPTAYSIQVTTDSYGRVSVKKVDATAAAEAVVAKPAVQIISARCSECHSGASPKAGLVYDGVSPVSERDIVRALNAVRSDKMPEDGKLPAAEKAAIMESLLDQWRASQPAPASNK